MQRKVLSILFLFLFVSGSLLRSEEGMWIPLLLEKYNIQQMQSLGFRLTAEDIYSVNKACMKDAVMNFGGGCSAELISPEGLIITNHHCGLSRIQSHSTVEHNYIEDGFWAGTRKEELPNPGLVVTFLRYMQDVTDRVMEGISEDMPEEEREAVRLNNMETIVREAVSGTHYSASISAFFHGNQYFLFLNEEFRDVRLVGAPPSSIGNFGGDTDNWVWPRHTGDFSLFRIYAGKDNKPAGYSSGNVPYRPATYFPISLRGVKEGDFAMVFGYPGSTSQYVPSCHVRMLTKIAHPALIEIRTRKLNVLNESMEHSEELRIKYTSKAYSVSNSWKRWQGELMGLERLDLVEKKERYEREFTAWLKSSREREATYGKILPSYDSIYSSFGEYYLVRNYFNEVFYRNGIEAMNLASYCDNFLSRIKGISDTADLAKEADRLKSSLDALYRDYDPGTDKKMFSILLTLFDRTVNPAFHPAYFSAMKKKFNGDLGKMAEWFYQKSILPYKGKMDLFLSSLSRDKAIRLMKDPMVLLFAGADRILNEKVQPVYDDLNREKEELNRLYMKAQMEYQPSRIFYPDANSTLRLSYGQVQGTSPVDGVWYKYYTTLQGIIEKENPAVNDYHVPARLVELYERKDFGRYGINGEMPVCFIATNHTTGGNSGSPVLNSEGQLIGINFDRAWEGVASDLIFDPAHSRNISLDIRYALFIIDKFAGAGYLLEEMTLVE